MTNLDLSSVLDSLRRYSEGEVSRALLELTLADSVLGHSESRPQLEDPNLVDERTLAFLIAEAICGFDGPETDLQLFSNRILLCWAQVQDPYKTLELLPLIRHHDDFSILVSKRRRGVIDQQGLASILRKRFTWDGCREWLERASLERTQALCDLIEADRYAEAMALLRSDPQRLW